MKILSLLLVLSCAFFASPLKAQISYGGTPTSFGSEFKTSQLAQAKVPASLLPQLDLSTLKAENAKGNNRFALATAVNIVPDNAGLWQNLPNGDRLWRVLLQVQSEEVTGMRLLFDKFNLPEGGKLFIYTDDHKMVLGSFTSENNHESGVFATTLLRGREVWMEYYEPVAVKGKAVISLNRVDQAYKNPQIEKKGKQKKGGPTDFGDAGACTLNINCTPLAADWQDEKRGVARILITDAAGSGWCSGSLINNTAVNSKPYFLTADHCGEGSTPTFLNQWVFDFNYEIINCSNTTTAPTPQSMTGASLKSRYVDSDVLLLELNQNVPLGYNAYLNGWDKAATLPAGGIGIHHPSGDVKKFSRDTDALTSVNVDGGATASGSFLNVSWNNGITEGGSSGSPLFNPAGRIVGQLFGGSSFCNALQDPDWYGKISVSWNGGGTAATRLSDWLDPLNTGATTLNGQNVGTPIIAKFTASTADITYLPAQITFTNTSIGATAWSWNFGTDASPATATTAGPHTVTYTTLGTRTVTLTINTNADIARKEISILPTLPTDYMPADGGNFETDNGHFLPVSGSGNLNFQRGNSAVAGKNGVASGSNAYVTGLTLATYPAQANAYLYTPNYNFSATGTYNVQFKTKFKTEPNYDGFLVEYSTNKGTSWIKLGTAVVAGWYTSTVPADVGMGGFPATTKIFSGTASTFETKTFNASTLAGNANVAFRFVFKADDTGQDAGVAIDDFQVTGPFVATALLPTNNATAVAASADLQITFSRAVSKGTTGNIVIKKTSDNSIIETIAVTSGLVAVAGKVATINPTNNLPDGTQVYVEIAGTAFVDASSVAYAGITGNSTWKFTTSSDLVAPTLVTLNPVNNATIVPVNANLVLTLNENVKKGTSGSITIKKVSDNSVVEDIPVTNANVSISNAVVTINPANDLAILTNFYIEVSNGAIQDLAGNNFAGFTGNTTWKFITDTETVPPTLVSLNPAHNSVNIALATNLVITLNENVKKGVGDIVIRKTSDNSAVETIAVSGANVTIAGAVVTINPNSDLVANTGYHVEVNVGAIQDIAGNNYAGFTGSNTWAFTTLDNVAPTLLTLNPANNATGVLSTSNLVMTFNENVKKGTAGNIVIKKISDNSVVETIAITNTTVTASNAIITINPANDLGFVVDYYVEVSAGAIQDLADNNYAGITGNSTWKFTTANETIPPTVVSLSPVHSSVNVALASNLVITFNENVKKGTGNILIKKTSDNTIAETINITGAAVSITGAVATINPVNDLTANTNYYVEINAGAIQDIAGNNYAGIVGNNTWGFASLETVPPTVVSFNPAHNSTNVPGANNLSITFNENVKKGMAGNIVIKKVSDNTVFETIAIANANVTVSGAVVTINPTTDLLFNTDFYVEISAGTIQDIAGNNFAGFVGAATWKFKTDFSTAIEDNQLGQSITVYPNPTEKLATLRIKQGVQLQDVHLRIMDMAGKTVWQKQVTQLTENQTFDWSSLPAGKFLLEIKTKQGTAIKMIVKL